MSMHNAAPFLRECIDSVLTQTFADFEFLIVDDGSTDSSAAIAASYTDPRLCIISRPHGFIESRTHCYPTHEENISPAWTRTTSCCPTVCTHKYHISTHTPV